MPLSRLDAVEVEIQIGELLQRIQKLYQVPGLDAVAASVLAGDTAERFANYPWGVVKAALQKPPVLPKKDPTYRITPETITEWVTAKNAEMVDEANRRQSVERQAEPMNEAEPISEETQKAVDEMLARLAADMRQTSIQAIGREIKKIRTEDQARERKSFIGDYRPPSAHEVMMSQYIVEERAKLYAADKTTATLQRFTHNGYKVYAKTKEDAVTIIEKAIERANG